MSAHYPYMCVDYVPDPFSDEAAVVRVQFIGLNTF